MVFLKGARFMNNKLIRMGISLSLLVGLSHSVAQANNDACVLSLKLSHRAGIGPNNESTLYSDLLKRVGFSSEAVKRLTTSLIARAGVSGASVEQATFRQRMIHYMTDAQVSENMEKFAVYQKWERLQRSDAYVRVVLSDKPITNSEMITLATEVIDVMPATVKAVIPQKYQTLLKVLKLAPGGAISPESIVNVAKPLLDQKAESIIGNPLLSMAWAFVPGELKTQAQELLKEATSNAISTMGDPLMMDGNSTVMREGLKDLILDLEIAMTYANIAPQLKGKEALQLIIPEDRKATSLQLQGLKLAGADGSRAVTGNIPLGESQFHVFVGSQTGRSYLFDSIESKTLLASEGMPELSIKTSGGMPVMVHVARNLDLAQANPWFKSLFENIKSQPEQYHLVIVDDLRVSATVLNKLFQSLSRLGNNTSMLISWNKLSELTSQEASELNERAFFYQIKKTESGAVVEKANDALKSTSNENTENLFDF